MLLDLEAEHVTRDEYPAPPTDQQRSDFRMTILSCLAQDFTVKELREYLPDANLQYSNLKKAKAHASDTKTFPMFQTKTVPNQIRV